MDSIKLFISCIQFLQNLSISFPYKYYQKAHHYIFKNFFRLSSVSISFRICLKPQILNRLNEEHKSQIKSDLNEFIGDDRNYSFNNKTINSVQSQSKILNINSLQKFLNEKFYQYTDINLKNVNDLFSVEILLVKRANSARDKYSGNVAFPGGKFEKEDLNDFQTAIRETQEEIGLNLCEDAPIVSRYLGPNTRFDITLDFRYLVTSHLFVIFDFFKESERFLVISKKELSDIFFVPFDYLLHINPLNQKSFDKQVQMKFWGNDVAISKLILNENEKFLVYGLTLRKIINFLNFNGNRNFTYSENIKFNGNTITSKLKTSLFYIITHLFNFTVNPFTSYKLFRNIIILSVICVIYAQSSNLTNFNPRF